MCACGISWAFEEVGCAMSKWTIAEEELLRDFAHKGAKAVSVEIARLLGVVRSPRAVEMHASRIHVSLRRLGQCPRCGTIGVHLSQKSGMCKLCTEEFYIEEERVFNELLREEAKSREEGAALDAAKRERLRLRQQNSRLCKRHGLVTKSKR